MLKLINKLLVIKEGYNMDIEEIVELEVEYKPYKSSSQLPATKVAGLSVP